MGNSLKRTGQHIGPHVVAQAPLKYTKLELSKNISDLSSKRCFLEFQIGNQLPERINIYLYNKIQPRTAENFRQLCTGEAGLTYKGTVVEDVDFQKLILCGDISKCHEPLSIYGGDFDDEDLSLPVDKRGLLVMANRHQPNSNGSMFFISLNELPELSGKFVVFGECHTGDKILDQIDMSRVPGTVYPAKLKISDCGEIKPLSIEDLLTKRPS